MNKFLSFGKSIPNDTIESDDTIEPDDENQNMIIQNQSAVPRLTSFLGDINISGIIRSSDIEITGNIIQNGRILSTSSYGSPCSTDESQSKIEELKTKLEEFINQDEINELKELVNDLTFKNTTNGEIHNLKTDLLLLKNKFEALTN